jgi:hypothetical protein
MLGWLRRRKAVPFSEERALELLNKPRQAKGATVMRNLPQGWRLDQEHCVVARALAAVGPVRVHWGITQTTRQGAKILAESWGTLRLGPNRVLNPPEIRRLESLFEGGKLPHLIASDDPCSRPLVGV